jgi:hypothetical protein
LHQSCHAIYIHAIKLRLRSTPHCTRAVYYGINIIIYQAAQAVKILKVTFYPLEPMVSSRRARTPPMNPVAPVRAIVRDIELFQQALA